MVNIIADIVSYRQQICYNSIIPNALICNTIPKV